MSKEMKYVIVHHSMPILLSQGQEHRDFNYLHPTSAGKCRIYFENERFSVDCCGESVGLNLKSDENDHHALEFMLNEY